MVAPAPQQSITVGDIRLTFLPDGDAYFVPTQMFPGTTEEAWQAHRQWLNEEGRYVTTLGAFLVETGDRNILVDLGIGSVEMEIPDFARAAGGRFLESLAAAGVSPERIDTVVYTHMHSDHTGWTTGGQGGLTFSGARHIIGDAAEFDFWRNNPDAAFAPPAETVLDPVENRIETAGDGYTVAPGMTLRATPGHTPGHQSVVLSSGAERAMILGDVMHCPAQLLEPDWSVLFDVDQDVARRTREALLAELEGGDTVLGCSHFPDSVFGRVVPAQGKRMWQTS
jgi:glyoxylase-like metal-dependent hydrolase (beta-lactamase superfamily II)